MCILYRGQGYIPRNRPDVYEKCAELLFDRWDRHRSIHVPEAIRTIEAHLRPAMMYLAHWIYTTDAKASSGKSLAEGVPEQLLIERAADYLSERRFADRADAEKAARDFIEFCTGRAWVFTDVGTTAEGEKLFKFTHRTFLEYFAAFQLVRLHETTEALGNVLRPHVAKGEWDVVAQLAVQIKHKNTESAGDKLLTLFLEQAQKSRGETKKNLLSFCIRCLSFIVPSPTITARVSRDCVDYCVEWGSYLFGETRSRIRQQYHESQASHLLLNLMSNASDENFSVIQRVIGSRLMFYFKGDQERKSKSALDVCFNLKKSEDELFGEIPHRKQEIASIVEETLDEVFSRFTKRANSICSQDWWLSSGALFVEKYPLTI